MSRPGSFRKGYRAVNIPPSQEDSNPSTGALPNISATGYNVAGRGQVRGVTNSPWGYEFHNRKNFFERGLKTSGRDLSVGGDKDEVS